MHRQLQNPRHQQLTQAYSEWMKAVGYNKQEVYDSPQQVRELLHWLEKRNQELESQDVTPYLYYLKRRRKRRSIGILKTSTLQKYYGAIKRLNTYLEHTERGCFELEEIRLRKSRKQPLVLTKEEIQQLYAALEDTPLGVRDRAMLGLYYGAGLRRSEGLNLNMEDVKLETGILHVRKGKGYKGRYVPLSKTVIEDLQNYQSLREKRCTESPSFLLSERGNRPTGETLQLRLKKLIKRASLNDSISLHTLRHSIATHLYQRGLCIEDIGRFLGHKSLDSTQVYVHLGHEDF